MKISYFHPDIKTFLNSLQNEVRVKVYGVIELLAIREYHLTLPFSKKIEKDIYELRISSLQNIRIFYTFHNNQIVLLHIVNKKTQKLSLHDLSTARRRLSILQS